MAYIHIYVLKFHIITVIRLPPEICLTLGLQSRLGLRHLTQGIIGFRTNLISFFLDVGLAQNLKSNRFLIKNGL